MLISKNSNYDENNDKNFCNCTSMTKKNIPPKSSHLTRRAGFWPRLRTRRSAFTSA
jgi:hypothetical protein